VLKLSAGRPILWYWDLWLDGGGEGHALETIGFIAIWEFKIRPEMRQQFERTYGPSGDWARLFRNSQAYIRTELLLDTDNPDAYFTLDYWSSREAYDNFRAAHLAEYEAIDRICEKLTVNEVEIGKFVAA
jgi:heme-degrading monooxygenase HmoA